MSGDKFGFDSDSTIVREPSALSAPGAPRRPPRLELVQGPGAPREFPLISEETVIEAIARLKPDAVVLDMQLKNGSGANVIRALRANAGLRELHVFVMSNHASPQLKAGCLELGANDYFDKVKDVALLARRIGELAGRKESGAL